MELARAVKQVTIRRVHFVSFGTHITLDHAHHHWVKVANPSQLQRAIVTQRSLVDLVLHALDKSAFDAFALILGQHAEDESEDTVGLVASDVPQGTQLLKYSESTVVFTDYTVQVRYIDKESDWLVVEIGEIYKVFVDNGRERLE